MKNSFLWKNASVIRFIPLVNILLILRFQIMTLRGIITRGRQFIVSGISVLFMGALAVPAVLITDHLGCREIGTGVIVPIVFYFGILLYDTLAIREEKRVRESGFFWCEDDRQ